jgi:hypothetical protein
MATSKEYFEKNTFLEFGTELSFKAADGFDIVVPIKVAYDFDGGSKHLRAYIPESEYPDGILAAVVQNLQAVWDAAAGLRISSSIANSNEKIESTDLTFSGRLLVYTPNVIEERRWQDLKDQLSPQGLHLLIRDGDYAKLRDGYEIPRAFISHDSRDKTVL